MRLSASALAVAILVAVPGRVVVAQADSASRTKPGGPTTTLPLKTERVLRFTTDEGTWLSLDLSADGQTIVFDLVGDLYTLPISGGKATRITDGPGFDGQPRFSPDGKTIVFTSDRDGAEKLWLVNPDGSNPRKLTTADKQQFMSPEWSPDGKYVFAARRAVQAYDHDLYMYHVDGGSGMKVLDRSIAPAFGTDSRYLWGTTAGPTGGLGGYQLFVLDRMTGERSVRSSARGSAMRPALSPDGKWLVYATRLDTTTSLMLRDLETSEDRELVSNFQHDEGESNDTRDAMPGSAFTPDSRALIAYSKGKIWRIGIPDGKMTMIPFTADVEQHMGPLVRFDYPVNDSVLTVKQIRDARLSPDGKRIAFTALDRLWVADFPSGGGEIRNARRLTSTNVGEFHPAWSSDGSSIVYVTWNEDAGGDVYRARTDGSGTPERLTRQSAFYASPNISPDGRRIVVVKGPRIGRVSAAAGRVMDLVWLPASGGATTRIAPGGGAPYFVRGDTSRVYVGGSSMRWDGTDRRNHVRIREGQPRISPDGERAITTVKNQIYVVTVPMVGPEPPEINVEGASVPVRRVSVVGGEFLSWTSDGKAFHYSLGNSFFLYDVEKAEAQVRDSVSRGRSPAGADSASRPRYAYESARTRVVIEVPKDKPRGSVVLRGGRVLTMKGKEIIQRADIVVTDNRITAVGPRGSVPVPANARVIDISNKIVIPGFVDVHAHMWGPGDVHATQLWEYLAQLAYGVTATRDPQTATTNVLSYEDMVESGAMIGPRIFSTGPGVFQNDEISNLDKARDVMRRYADYYNTWTVKAYKIGDRKDRQWLNMAGKDLKLSSTSEGTRDFKMNVTQMLDGYAGHEHNFSVAPLYRDMVEVIAFSGITYTPTLLVSYGAPNAEHYFYTNFDIHDDAKMRRFVPHEEIDQRALRRREWNRPDQYGFKRHAEQIAKIVAAGGRVGLGGHGQLQGLGVHWEMWAMQSGGLPPHDLLRAVTIMGAESIGVAKDLGSIEVGKLADLVILDKDPLVDIHNTTAIRYVMKNGRVYDGNTMDEVWPRARPLPKQWWQ